MYRYFHRSLKVIKHPRFIWLKLTLNFDQLKKRIITKNASIKKLILSISDKNILSPLSLLGVLDRGGPYFLLLCIIFYIDTVHFVHLFFMQWFWYSTRQVNIFLLCLMTAYFLWFSVVHYYLVTFNDDKKWIEVCPHFCNACLLLVAR